MIMLIQLCDLLLFLLLSTLLVCTQMCYLHILYVILIKSKYILIIDAYDSYRTVTKKEVYVQVLNDCLPPLSGIGSTEFT